MHWPADSTVFRLQRPMAVRNLVMAFSRMVLLLLSTALGLAASQTPGICEGGVLNMDNHGLTDIPEFDPITCTAEGPLHGSFVGNNFGTLPIRGFQSYTRMEFLNLSNSNISRIEHGAFENNYGVTDIDLSGNPLTVLEGQPFQHLRLESLSLRGCQLMALGVEVFADGLWGLTRLDIAFNNLTYIPRALFRNMAKLGYLNLSHNMIEYLPRSLVDENRKLMILDLSYNRLTEIFIDFFYFLPPRASVDISWNEFGDEETIELQFGSFPGANVEAGNLLVNKQFPPSTVGTTEGGNPTTNGNSVTAQQCTPLGIRAMDIGEPNSRNSNEPDNSTTFIIGMILGVVVILVLGGVAIWRRKRLKECYIQLTQGEQTGGQELDSMEADV